MGDDVEETRGAATLTHSSAATFERFTTFWYDTTNDSIYRIFLDNKRVRVCVGVFVLVVR